ncbi:MAG: DUF4097 family beta strand repeat protein [Theionarchaea archaeon]|nr:DUF4097 family beta strand repeat protein [Theionarchaea archaeon]MBU7000308.1 DUF4097 family beta strand repeat protein [Theionarchaea archaeon]MBU7020749.1 DUF4097 family beta strand repeat protein [Theionarchaea archaeon]MBU7034884.1 DUF4097 family beta strand repeat protein [Theionarchaea archaeon]MBU7040119.1 DUF4097 family beta strand repeat protein [Theionarchaea archaeon]
MKRIAIISILILTLGCVDQGGIGLFVQKEVEQLFENEISPELLSIDFETHNGSIELSIWDQSSYRIEITKWARATTSDGALEKADALKVDFSETEQSGKVTLTIRAERATDAGAHLNVFLPSVALDHVDLSSSNGHIQVNEITAASVVLQTSNARVQGSFTADSIAVSTSNGGVEGFFQGESVTIETSNAAVDVECGEGGTYRIRTSNGRADVTIGTRGTYDILTSNASIDITVKGDFNFDLSTSNARITIDAGEVVYTLDSDRNKKGFTAETPDVFITASTSNGSITVRKY